MWSLGVTAAGWAGGLAVWGAAMLGLAALPSSDPAAALAAIGDGPSPQAIVINERFVEMGLLDPIGPDGPPADVAPPAPLSLPAIGNSGAAALIAAGGRGLCPDGNV